MSAIWSGVSTFIYSAFIDFIVFVLVDIIAKTLLKEIGWTEQERRLLWLGESLVLVLSCVFVYLLDHTPWTLAALALLTFVSTQLPSRLSVVQWWYRLKTHWDEHQYMQQHVESIQQMQENLARHQQAQAALHTIPPPQPPLLYPPPNPPRGLGPPPPYPRLPLPPPPLGSTAFARDKMGPAVTSTNGNHWDLSGSGSAGSVPVQPMVGLSQQLQQQQQLRQRKTLRKYEARADAANTNLNHWYGGAELRRRPLHSSVDRSLESKVTNGVASSGIGTRMTASVVNATASIKSGLMSVMGFQSRSSSEHLPAGMKNNGQNMCFINAVLQCLARTPHLVEHLTNKIQMGWQCPDVAESLLFSTTVDLLKACKQSAIEGHSVVLDASTFRQAAAALNCPLVAPLGEYQMQQDVAEFLFWLLNQLHATLNDPDGRKAPGDRVRFTSPSLETIELVYGALIPERIEELKAACRREINMANALENETYAGPIQRLCDLEWLTHKQANNSVIDDLFEGQLVGALHCLSDHHISVSLEPFHILPVQIAAPRGGSKQVFLEDCFTAYCNVEHMLDGDGLHCSFCPDGEGAVEGNAAVTSSRVTRSAAQAATPSQSRMDHTRANTDSAFLSPSSSAAFVSPILGCRDFVNDSGFHDNNHKTSTPIRRGGPSLAEMAAQPTHLRDFQKRTLLRQLPECLVIHLVRFSFVKRTGRTKKIKAQVRLCLKGLDLTEVIYDNVTQREDLSGRNLSYRYDLYGFCVHIGGENTNCGHYLAYCEAEPGRWFRFDDEIVTEVNIEMELNTREVLENAYVLFYKRVH